VATAASTAQQMLQYCQMLKERPAQVARAATHASQTTGIATGSQDVKHLGTASEAGAALPLLAATGETGLHMVHVHVHVPEPGLRMVPKIRLRMVPEP
jgi:hypothetical protein